MRALLIVTLFAALVSARAEQPEPATNMRTPAVKLNPSMGWRLDAVVMIDLVNNTPVLVIEGDVINASKVERASPSLRFALRDGDRRELFHWTVKLDQPAIGPGDWVPFATRLERPPEQARTVEIQTIDVELP